jgi:hypothetical protein
VFWPKGDTLSVMLKADFAAGMRTAEGLVDAELNSNNNNNSRGSSAVNKVVDYYCSTATAVVSPPVPEHYYIHGLAKRPCDQLQLVLALCCRLGGATGELCAQRALRALITVGGVITEACAAAIATAVSSFGWTVLGDAVLAVVRSTQLVNLDSAAALALKLSLLSADKLCSGTAAVATITTAAAAAATTAAPAAEHVDLELAAVKQEQAAAVVAPATTVKTELTAAVKSEPACAECCEA